MPDRAPVVIVTGASAGVGRAIALRFARAGARVGLIARDEHTLSELARQLESEGAEAAFAAVDVANAAAVFAAAEDLERKLGGLDIWINDAMLTVFSRVTDLTADEFRRVTEVTYLGCVHGTMAASKSMRRRRHGRIIQIGSALAYRGIPLQAAYCGAKHAIRGFTDSLRTELLHDGSGIRISMIELPAVNTPQFDWARAHIPHAPRPMGRPIQPEVVADAVFRVARRNGREYWLGTSTLVTILGNAVWPGFLDRYLARKAIAGQQTALSIGPSRRDNLETPVTRLHRVRGSFSAEAGDRAILVPEELARVGALAVIASFGMAVGLLIGSLRRGR